MCGGKKDTEVVCNLRMVQPHLNYIFSHESAFDLENEAFNRYPVANSIRECKIPTE